MLFANEIVVRIKDDGNEEPLDKPHVLLKNTDG
jgi:hypothetical protein